MKYPFTKKDNLKLLPFIIISFFIKCQKIIVNKIEFWSFKENCNSY